MDMAENEEIAISSTKKQPFTKQKRDKRWIDEERNPCLAEANASFQCLHDHNFNREICNRQFLNYKNCKNFWGRVIKERKAQGISPPLPPPEEREKILQGVA